MRPVLPQTECGAYKRAAITAVEQFPVTTRTVQQVPFARKPPRLAANPAINTVPEAEPWVRAVIATPLIKVLHMAKYSHRMVPLTISATGRQVGHRPCRSWSSRRLVRVTHELCGVTAVKIIYAESPAKHQRRTLLFCKALPERLGRGFVQVGAECAVPPRHSGGRRGNSTAGGREVDLVRTRIPAVTDWAAGGCHGPRLRSRRTGIVSGAAPFESDSVVFCRR